MEEKLSDDINDHGILKIERLYEKAEFERGTKRLNVIPFLIVKNIYI